MKTVLREEGTGNVDECVRRAYNITVKEGHPVQIVQYRTVPVREAMKVLWPPGFWEKCK